MNLASVLVCIVIMFLFCHFPRLIINCYEFLMIDSLNSDCDDFMPPVWFLCLTRDPPSTLVAVLPLLCIFLMLITLLFDLCLWTKCSVRSDWCLTDLVALWAAILMDDPQVSCTGYLSSTALPTSSSTASWATNSKKCSKRNCDGKTQSITVLFGYKSTFLYWLGLGWLGQSGDIDVRQAGPLQGPAPLQVFGRPQHAGRHKHNWGGGAGRAAQ